MGRLTPSRSARGDRRSQSDCPKAIEVVSD